MPTPKDPIKYAEWRRKVTENNARRGKKFIFTEAHRINLGKANKGHIPWIKGKKQTPEHIAKRLESRIKNGTTPKLTAPRGENHYLWIKDRTKLAKRQERMDSAYREWRMEVFKRDGFVCKINNSQCSGNIRAHHILPWSQFPELRYEVNNGITLCPFHHPRKRNDENRLSPYFQNMVIVKVN